ncbi:NADPH-dependent FMN reductase [Robiginitalea sediminis]|uniref:NADPH-dependent FMN reductase n=1 Tax=Robiginitalea sediminis TaxID=1982593 RepID=UPI000B4BCA20|nr:NAD(P)H-dependent oxidoreductase [Robiginitalea sediminis]
MALILAMAGSNSTTSINLQLVRYTARQLPGHEVRVMDLSQVPIPMYSEDREKQEGFPVEVEDLYQRLQACDGLVFSVNEHNGNPSAYTKNLLDWLSRLGRSFLEGTPVLLMSASPGKRGAASSFEVVQGMIPRFGGTVAAGFSLPSFGANFSRADGITDPDLRASHREAIETFLQSLP